MSRHSIEFRREDSEGVETSHKLPAKWVICGTCDGDGTTVFGWGRGDAAVHTQEDFDEDPDLMDDLMSGRLDKACPDCEKGRQLVVNEDLLKANNLELYKLWMKAEKDEREYQAMCRSERMNGA